MVVGYKLTDGEGVVYQEWGGVWGQCPSVPNPISLPNGDVVNAPSINTDYNGYLLVEWSMEEPPPSVPASITPRQCRLLLHQQGLLSQVEVMVASSTEDVRITWEYALEFRRDDPILNVFAANLVPPLTDKQIDQFFIEAAKL